MANATLKMALAVLVVSLMAFPADASPRGIPRGKAIARLNCARCHAIGAKGESRDAKAPPFRTLSKRYRLEGLEEALAEGVVVGHEGLEMPHFQMTPGQIDAFLAYLRAVQEK